MKQVPASVLALSGSGTAVLLLPPYTFWWNLLGIVFLNLAVYLAWTTRKDA